MKKLILVFAAIAITAGAYAQTDSKMTPRDNNNTQNQNVPNSSFDKSNSDGVFMENGKMIRVENGQRTFLHDNEVTLSNGTRIMSDGTYIKNDGTKMTMKDGQHMDMSGNMIHNENVQNNSAVLSNPDGVYMQNGRMMQVKNGQMTYQDNDVIMSNGTKIMKDGTYLGKDGTKITLQEGQRMDMSGNLTPSKTIQK